MAASLRSKAQSCPCTAPQGGDETVVQLVAGELARGAVDADQAASILSSLLSPEALLRLQLQLASERQGLLGATAAAAAVSAAPLLPAAVVSAPAVPPPAVSMPLGGSREHQEWCLAGLQPGAGQPAWAPPVSSGCSLSSSW